MPHAPRRSTPFFPSLTLLLVAGLLQPALAVTCVPITLYENDFESGSGLADWTMIFYSGEMTGDWRGIQACAAHSGTRIFRFGGSDCTFPYNAPEILAARPMGESGIAVPPEAQQLRLSFWHRWSFAADGGKPPFLPNGGRLDLSIDGGEPVAVRASAFTAGVSYTSGYHFTRLQSTFVFSEVDLDAVCAAALGSSGCAGHTIRIGFRVEAQTFDVGTGWFLDDVKVTACTLHGCTGAPAPPSSTPTPRAGPPTPTGCPGSTTPGSASPTSRPAPRLPPPAPASCRPSSLVWPASPTPPWPPAPSTSAGHRLPRSAATG